MTLAPWAYAIGRGIEANWHCMSNSGNSVIQENCQLGNPILDSLEKAMAPPSVLFPGNSHGRRSLVGCMQSMGSCRVRHNRAISLSLFTFMHWRRKWQPTPVFLPGESRGRGSLVGGHLWGRTESDTTEATQQQQQQCELINTYILVPMQINSFKRYISLLTMVTS